MAPYVGGLAPDTSIVKRKCSLSESDLALVALAAAADGGCDITQIDRWMDGWVDG